MNEAVLDSIPKKGWGAFSKEAGGLAAAEILSSSIAIGAIAYADKLAPKLVESATDGVSKLVVQPLLPFFENLITNVCRLDACKIDTTKSKEEQAHMISRAIVLGLGSVLPAMAIKVALRRGINEAVGLGDENPWWHIHKWNDHDKKLAVWDEGVHYGSLIVMNTIVPQPTDIMIKHTSDMMQKLFGWSKKRADESAIMAVAHEIPNLLGLMAGVGAIAHARLK